jgi:hypothetical protein
LPFYYFSMSTLVAAGKELPAISQTESYRVCDTRLY